MTSNITQVKKGDVEIKVIRDKCIGAATCVVYAPSTFDLDEDNIAIIKNENWDRLEKIVPAAQSCPVLAIEVFVKGKKVYPK